MPENAIEVEGLRKQFDQVVAVDDVSFGVPAGGFVALLGGNGAGKTTTIGMLLGLILPTSGRITVPVAENLGVYAHLYGVRNVKRRIAELARDLDLENFIKRPTGSLSAGQRTRVALAKAMVNEPDLLLLDEPTASLDPDTADWVRRYLRDYQARTGASVLLASHNMTEVERLCDDVLMLRQGRIVDQGSPADLIARYGRANLEEVFLDIARGEGRASQEAAAE